MLLLNFLRALATLFAIGLYQIYNLDFLSVDQGAVIFVILFVGLTVYQIVEERIIDGFNPKTSQET